MQAVESAKGAWQGGDEAHAREALTDKLLGSLGVARCFPFRTASVRRAATVRARAHKPQERPLLTLAADPIFPSSCAPRCQRLMELART